MGVKQNSQIELSRANRVHLLKWSENLTASSIQIDSGWMALSSNQIEDDGDRANKRSSFKATLVYSNQSEGLVNNSYYRQKRYFIAKWSFLVANLKITKS